MGAGCGGTSPCTVDKPAKIGMPICSSDMFVFLATVNTIGISKMTPTSKKTGMPTINPTSIIAQCTLCSPKRSIKVVAIRSAPPDSAIILPSIVPSPMTMAIVPSVPPRPPVIELTTSSGFMPASSPSSRAEINSVTNGFHLYLEISKTRKTITIKVHNSSVALWLIPNSVPKLKFLLYS